MSAGACATPGCGHAKDDHDRNGCFAQLDCLCTAYLPPRPAPEEGESCETPMKGFYGADTLCARPKGHDGKHYQLRDHTPAPAPHAEAEAAWEDHCEMTQEQLSHPDFWAMEKTAFIAGYLRGRGDRG